MYSAYNRLSHHLLGAAKLQQNSICTHATRNSVCRMDKYMKLYTVSNESLIITGKNHKKIQLKPWLTLSNPIFLPTAYSPALICFGQERGW
jgi:hypothetical protein